MAKTNTPPTPPSPSPEPIHCRVLTPLKMAGVLHRPGDSIELSPTALAGLPRGTVRPLADIEAEDQRRQVEATADHEERQATWNERREGQRAQARLQAEARELVMKRQMETQASMYADAMVRAQQQADLAERRTKRGGIG